MSAVTVARQLPAWLTEWCPCRLMCHLGGTGRRRPSQVLQLAEASWALVLKLVPRLAMRQGNRPLSMRRQTRWTMLPESCWPAPACLPVIHSDRTRLRPAEMQVGWWRLAASRRLSWEVPMAE
jgi:hypothetical protein